MGKKKKKVYSHEPRTREGSILFIYPTMEISKQANILTQVHWQLKLMWHWKTVFFTNLMNIFAFISVLWDLGTLMPLSFLYLIFISYDHKSSLPSFSFFVACESLSANFHSPVFLNFPHSQSQRKGISTSSKT